MKPGTCPGQRVVQHAFQFRMTSNELQGGFHLGTCIHRPVHGITFMKAVFLIIAQQVLKLERSLVQMTRISPFHVECIQSGPNNAFEVESTKVCTIFFLATLPSDMMTL